jgi:hypothetical protein
MKDWGIIIALVAVLCGVLFALFRRARKSSSNVRSSEDMIGEYRLLAARHYQYFSQIRQALSADDRRYLMEVAPPRVAEKAFQERRRIARRFLEGLHEDFSNLTRLGRIIATLSPVVSHEQEAERLALALKFQALYALVWLRLATGSLPLQHLENLTALVGSLATRMEEAMTQINALGARGLSSNLSA